MLGVTVTAPVRMDSWRRAEYATSISSQFWTSAPGFSLYLQDGQMLDDAIVLQKLEGTHGQAPTCMFGSCA